MTVLQNNTKGMLIHKDVRFSAGEIKDIPADIAQIWLKIDGIVEYVDPGKNRVKEAAAQAKIAQLEAENKELREKIKALQNNEESETKDNFPDFFSMDVKELKEFCTKGKIKFPNNAGRDKMIAIVCKHYNLPLPQIA